MIGALLVVYVIVAALGVLYHTAYERKPHNPYKFIDPGQIFFNMLIPFIFGTLAFLLVRDIISYPPVRVFVSDEILFYFLIASSCACFIGCGMHLTGKILSRIIEKSHPAYRLNQFYHIYLGHIPTYGGFMFFMLSLSLLALRHPSGFSKYWTVYIIGGFVFGYLASVVSRRPVEIIKIFGYMKVGMIIAYLAIVYPHRTLLISSSFSLFMTSACFSVLALSIYDILSRKK